MTHPRVHPVKVYRYDKDLGVDVRRTVGFQARIGDRSLAPARSSYAEARADLHTQEQAAPSKREDVSPDVSAEA